MLRANDYSSLMGVMLQEQMQKGNPIMHEVRLMLRDSLTDSMQLEA